MSYEARLEELKLSLPPAPKPVGVYRPMIVVGNLAYLSGHGPLQSDGSLLVGCVGRDVDQTAGYAAARQTGLAMLATLRAGWAVWTASARGQGVRHGQLRGRVPAAPGGDQWLQ